MTADIDDLHAWLDDDPSDQVTRLVLADAYDDAGDDAMADGLRRMAGMGVVPTRHAFDERGRPLGPCPAGIWWVGVLRSGLGDDGPDAGLLSCFVGGRRAAEEALCRALALEATR